MKDCYRRTVAVHMVALGKALKAAAVCGNRLRGSEAENMGVASRMVALAERVAHSLMDENTVGVVLFGSLARGRVDELSDLDLALVVEGGEPGLEEKLIGGVRVEVWRYDIKHFLHTFEDEKYRGRDDSWFLSSLWVGLMREGVILEDPHGLLRKWRRQALDWRWRKEEILPLVRKAESCLRVAVGACSRERFFEGIIALRDCCYNLANAQIMIHNRIPSVRPKDIYRGVKQVGLKEFFDGIQGLEKLEKNRVERLLGELKRLLDDVWREPRGARTEYRNAVKSLARGELKVAVLNARYSAFFVGCRILQIEGEKTPVRLYDTETHLEMLDRLKGREGFIEVYRGLHGAEELSSKRLRGFIRSAHRLLGSFPLNS